MITVFSKSWKNTKMFHTRGLAKDNFAAVRISLYEANVAQAPRRWTRLSRADRARVIERYEAGETSTSLAGELGIAKSTILAILREVNVVVRRQLLTPQQVSEAAALYESGCSLSQSPPGCRSSKTRSDSP